MLKIVVALVKIFAEQSSTAPPADQEARLGFFCCFFQFKTKPQKQNKGE